MTVTKTFRAVILAAILALTPFSASAQDSATREAIVELIEITDATQLMDQMSTLMMTQMLDVIRAANPEFPEEMLLEFQARMTTVFRESEPEFIDLMVELYARHFTDQEVRDLIDFYQTPTGRKTIAVMPTLMQESMEVGAAWGRKVGERVAKEVLSETAE